MEKYPQVILGAGRQAAHILNLLEWMDLPWSKCLLFDDGIAQSQVGARGLTVQGKLDTGIRLCLEKKMTAMVALGSRVAADRYTVFERARVAGVELVNLIHASCEIAPSALELLFVPFNRSAATCAMRAPWLSAGAPAATRS